MSGIFNKVFMALVVVWAFYSLFAADDNFIRGTVLEKEGKYNEATEEYWRAAIQGSESAVERLSGIYNRWKRAASYDWGIPEKYLQSAADARFARDGKTAREYDGCFVIVAAENAIIRKLGVENISKPYRIFAGGDRRCQSALEKLEKKFRLRGKKGIFYSRAENYDSPLGDVLVVDRKTALEQFQFTSPPISDWTVYVKCPGNSFTLIPFYDFHRYVYEEKMKAFTELCNNLGATSAKVYYCRNDVESSSQDYQVNGRMVTTFESAKTQVKVATRNSKEERADLSMSFSGNSVIRKTSNPWLDSEPTWRAMQNSRTNPLNSLTEFVATFHYTEDYMVNVETQAAFSKAGLNLGSNTRHEFQTFSSITWSFHVKFLPAKAIIPFSCSYVNIPFRDI